VLPYAVAEAYGTPEELRRLIARAHALEISLFLDVVYNHFGPDGNYLPLYARRFFRDDRPTPWGPAIDFRVPQVRHFFADNARQWLFDYGFDGLRFDAVHAMVDQEWLDDLVLTLKREAGERHIHLVLENENNGADHLRRGFDAQWNDDLHHALHVLLTGETNGYYQDFAAEPARRLAKALAEGFVYQGQPSANRGGSPRGEPSRDLGPTAFVSFLQNHDQTGNRALGERLTRLADPRALKAAIALLLLAPQIPLIFMGEEVGSQAPFLFFTDHGPQLAQAVREGRKREFAAFLETVGSQDLPDPNALASFRTCLPDRKAPASDEWSHLYRRCLSLRHHFVIPSLAGARSVSAEVLGEKAAIAQWRMGDGRLLTLACNLGPQTASACLPREPPFYGQTSNGIPAFSTIAWLSE
jgi:maltooligosyltrehalose trehalohydrolase